MVETTTPFPTQMTEDEKVNVVFDLDSTLITDESLEEVILLALKESGKNQLEIDQTMASVQEATNLGMRDGMPLSETIPLRLSLLKEIGVPVKKEHFEAIAQKCKEAIIEGIPEMIQEARQEFGERIRFLIVSGGPIECVKVVADELGITDYAGNEIVLDENGNFDSETSLIHNSKIEPISELLGKNQKPEKTIMVGDGSTDLAVFLSGVSEQFIAQLSVVGKENRPNIIEEKLLQKPGYKVAESIVELSEYVKGSIWEAIYLKPIKRKDVVAA